MLKLQLNLGLYLLCLKTIFRFFEKTHETLRFIIILDSHHSLHRLFHRISKHQWFQIFNLQGPNQNFKISFQVGSVEDHHSCKGF